NLANGEDNHDGENNNYSTNFGVEGETDDSRIVGERLRYAKNMLATLLLSQGVPMLLAGDEFRRTQQGNNNAYCQDNETSWVDWSLLERHAEIHRFTERMFAFRRMHPVLRRSSFYSNSDVSWFDAAGVTPDWSDPRERSLAC